MTARSPILPVLPRCLAAVVVLAGALTATSASAHAATPAGTSSESTVVVGSQHLTACGTDPAVYCGTLPVPLDYSDPDSPDISVAYRWYPATSPVGGVATGTVMPVEGGPGYPSIGSVAWDKHQVEGPSGYATMYGSLLDNWNMLVVDLRGTGQSTSLDCPALQDYTGQASGTAFTAAVGACADKLDHRWRRPSGGFYQASDLFTSAPAAADVASVIRALGLHGVDLYGDSYGSFFAQVFASRYPGLIGSVVLDSTYPTQDLDPWYRSTIDSMPADFDTACLRSPACAQAAAGPSWSRIEDLAGRLRTAPESGTVPGPSGALEHVTMNAVGLVDLVNDAAGDPMVYRELDASARALLLAGDPDPLLRLYAQRLASDEAYFDTPAAAYSGELYFAVSCLDYPQLFDMSDPEEARLTQLSAAEDDLPSGTFAPFTTAEWLDQDEYTEAYTACAAWPSPAPSTPPPTTGQPLVPASMPILVLGGEFDTWTPPSGVPQVLGQLGGHSRFVELANATHVVGEGDTACGSQLVQAFVADPASLDAMDTSCAAAVAPIRTVGVYAQSLAAVPPLTPGASNHGSTTLLRLGAVAVATAGDALERYLAIGAALDHGLHGGTARTRRGGRLITLDRDTLVPDVPVSGTVSVSATAASATVTARAGRTSATFEVAWPLAGTDAVAQVSGRSSHTTVTGTTDAP